MAGPEGFAARGVIGAGQIDTVPAFGWRPRESDRDEVADDLFAALPDGVGMGDAASSGTGIRARVFWHGGREGASRGRYTRQDRRDGRGGGAAGNLPSAAFAHRHRPARSLPRCAPPGSWSATGPEPGHGAKPGSAAKSGKPASGGLRADHRERVVEKLETRARPVRALRQHTPPGPGAGNAGEKTQHVAGDRVQAPARV